MRFFVEKVKLNIKIEEGKVYLLVLYFLLLISLYLFLNHENY